MKATFTIIIFFVNLTLFGQVNDADAFFTGSYDKSFVHQHKIKQVHVDIYIEGNKSAEYILDFNYLGFLTKQTIFDKRGKIGNEYLFRNNKEGDPIERITISHEFDKLDTVTFTKIYEAGQLVQEASSQLPFVTSHTYNTKGKRIQSTTFLEIDTSMSAKRIFFYIYDTKGKLKSIREDYVARSSSTPVRIGLTEYIYDDANNITSILREGKANYSFSYYEDGLLKEKTVKMPEDFSGLNIVDKYSYIFW